MNLTYPITPSWWIAPTSAQVASVASDAGDSPPADADDTEAWDTWHRCHLALAILGHRHDDTALRDARRALDGWTLGELAAGQRGRCQFCVGTTGSCDTCGSGVGQGAF